MSRFGWIVVIILLAMTGYSVLWFFTSSPQVDVLTKPEDALKKLDTAIYWHPKNAVLYSARAAAYVRLGKMDLALADYNKAIELYSNPANRRYIDGKFWIVPRDFVALESERMYYERAKVHLALKNYDKSIADCDTFTKFHDAMCGLVLRGQVYEEMGEPEKAITNFTTVIERKTDNFSASEAYMRRGMVYSDQHDYLKAQADLDRAVETDPRSVSAHMWRASFRCERKDFDGAVADYTSTLELFPEFEPAYSDRAYAFDKKGDYNRALKDYEKALELRPNDPELLCDRSVVYRHKGDYDRALADCDKAIELDPSNAGSYAARGTILRRLRQYDRAIADCNHAIELDPKSNDGHYGLGRIHYEQEDYDAAIADFNRAVESDPEDYETYNARAKTWFKKGDYGKAWTDADACRKAGGVPDLTLVEDLYAVTGRSEAPAILDAAGPEGGLTK